MGLCTTACLTSHSNRYANNTEIDVIWDKWQETLEPLRSKLNTLLKRSYDEWEVPRAAEDPWAAKAAAIFQKLLAEQQLGDDARPTKLKRSSQ